MTRREKIRKKILDRCVPTPPPPGPLKTPCQIWQGPTSGDEGRGKDYPRMNLDGGTVAPHIAIWVVENGPIPPRKQLDHLCRVRRCCAEDHLEMVTHKENQRRRDQARRILCEAAIDYAEAMAA